MKPFTETQQAEAKRIINAFEFHKKEDGVRYVIRKLQNELNVLEHSKQMELGQTTNDFWAYKAMTELSEYNEANNKILHKYMEDAGVK